MADRSKTILTRPEWSINRAYYKSMGYSDDSLDHPIIGIANAWSTTVPGHVNLRDVQDLRDMEDQCAPTCGSCSFLGTANTMCCIAEALGMSLTGSAMIPATHAKRMHVAHESGIKIVDLVKSNN